MPVKIDTHLEPSENAHKKLLSFIRQYRNLKIDFLGYYRVYHEGLVAGLYSDPAPLRSGLAQGTCIPVFGTDGIIVPPGYYLTQDLRELVVSRRNAEEIDRFISVREELARTHPAKWRASFFIVFKNVQYDELFYFSTSIADNILRFFVRQNIDHYMRVCFTFLAEMATEIEAACQVSYKYPLLSDSKEQAKALGRFERLRVPALETPIEKYRFVLSKTKEVFLTTREFEALTVAAQGKSPDQCAEALGVSVKGYESALRRIKDKMGLRRKGDLVKAYQESIYSGT